MLCCIKADNGRSILGKQTSTSSFREAEKGPDDDDINFLCQVLLGATSSSLKRFTPGQVTVMKSSTQLLWIFLWIASIYLLQSCVVCSAGLPVDDWADGVEKATDHNHWEHIVKKRASVERHSEDHSEDDTSHIVNIQEYYRAVFDEGWEDYEDNEQELFNLLGTLEKIVKQDTLSPHAEATAQKLADVLEFGLHSKPIRGRYIVMFQEGSDDYMLDRTITVLKQANVDSDGRIRATDLHPLRYVGKGFTATLNRKAVDLVSYPMLGIGVNISNAAGVK